MKKLSIYIDYSGEDEYEFSKMLQERLKTLDGVSNVLTYKDIEPGNQGDWENNTLKAIKHSNIVIPILSENYLSFVSNPIEEQFSKIIESKEKFLFPILYKSSEWGSYSWIVKSKLIPDDGNPLLELSKTDSEKIINGFIKTIKNILLRVNSESVAKPKRKLNEGNVIFISHDHDDADFAELLKLRLEKNKLNGWIDSERLKIGQDWREEIDQGIENSIAVIAIMTPNARKSEYVTYEWAFAWGKGIKVFPIMLKQTQMHPRLESLQYLDFTNRASRPWEKLIDSIKEITK